MTAFTSYYKGIFLSGKVIKNLPTGGALVKLGLCSRQERNSWKTSKSKGNARINSPQKMKGDVEQERFVGKPESFLL
jgi:hypothetical protein